MKSIKTKPRFKKCVNCQHLYIGQLFLACNKIRQKPITDSGIYKFNNCPSFEGLKEKDYTGIPDSLWKLGQTEAKTKKKVGDITLRELNSFCKPALARDCNKCPLLDKDTYICLAHDKQFEREVELDDDN